LEPLLSSDEVAGADNLLVGAVTMDEGTVHAWIVAFGADMRQVLHLSVASPSTPVAFEDSHLDDLDLDLADPGPIPTSVGKDLDGTWVMYGWGQASDPADGEIFWRATSTSPSGPWSNDPGPFYGVGEANAWDGGWIDYPAVTSAADRRTMIYEGAATGTPNISQIGIADSSNGIDFIRPSGPALSPAQCPDTRSLRMPRVLESEGGYLMAFLATPERGDEAPIMLVTTPDLGSLNCERDLRVVGASDLEPGTAVHSFGLYQSADGPTMLLELIEEETTSSGLWLARVE
jgi:hypothetical protein